MASTEGAAPGPWAPMVSVIVPTHLPDPPYLGETLASVVAQEWARWEVIVVDDGSPAALGTLQKLVDVDPRISLVRAPKGGRSRARNVGLGHAQGELVAFLDSDDYWYPGHLSGAVAALAGRPDAVGAYSVLAQVLGTEPEPFEVNHQSGPVDLRTALSGGNRPYLNSLVARRRAVERTGGFDPAFDGAEDKDLIYRLLAQGPCLYVDAPTVAYRVHAQNVSADIVQLSRSDARVFAVHRGRAVAAGDHALVAAIDLGVARARRYSAAVAVSQALAATRSGQLKRAAALSWWALRWSPAQTFRSAGQGLRRRLPSAGRAGDCK